ncbi:MAG: hypothetical protein N3A58_02865 [Spirochaetes bacterium]|nr:hypothetical protein [Spirochaetota bacterium]
MANVKNSIKQILIKYNIKIFLIIFLLILSFFIVTTIYLYKINIKFYSNLVQNLNFNFREDFIKFLDLNQKKNIYKDVYINCPEEFIIIHKFISQNLENFEEIKLLLIENTAKNNINCYSITLKKNKNSDSNFIFYNRLDLNEKFTYKIKKSIFYYYFNYKFYFLTFLDKEKYLILEIPFKTFFNLQIIFIFLFILSIIIFLYLFYRFTIRYYRRFVNNIHKIYLYLNSLTNKELNVNIEKSLIEELDILIEKIKILRNDLIIDNEYINKLLEIIKNIIKESTDSFIYFDNSYKIIYLNDSAKMLLNINNNEVNKTNQINYPISFEDLKLDSDSFNKLILNIKSEKNCFEININSIKFICNLFKEKELNILMLKNEQNIKNNTLELNFLREFLPNFAHELRSPLNTIIGFSEIILEGIEGDISPKLKEDIQAINDSSKTLLFYINQIIEFYSLKYKDEIKEEVIFHSSSIINLIKSFFLKFIKNNILKIEFYDFFEENIKLDKFKLIAAFINLFSFILEYFSEKKYNFYIIKRENKPIFFISTESVENNPKLYQDILNFTLPQFEESIINENIIESNSQEYFHIYYSNKLFSLINYKIYFFNNSKTFYILIF